MTSTSRRYSTSIMRTLSGILGWLPWAVVLAVVAIPLVRLACLIGLLRVVAVTSSLILY